MADIDTSPNWPSLYNPSREIVPIQHRNAIQPGASYLHHVRDIFLFTFFWTVIFYTPIFITCGAFAFVNITFPPTLTSLRRPISQHFRPNTGHQDDSYPLTPTTGQGTDPSSALLQHRQKQKTKTTGTLQKRNERRSRLTFACLVLLAFFALGILGALVTSAATSLVLAGLFQAGKYHMSTWIPFLWAAISVIIGLLSIWPSVIDII